MKLRKIRSKDGNFRTFIAVADYGLRNFKTV